MLYSEQMKLIIDKFGLDPSTLPDNLYSTLLDAIYKLDVGSGGGKPTQTKNVTIDENGTTNIVPDSGYTLSQVTVNVDVEDTPTQVKSIDVTENGDVSVTPDNGYVLSRVDINVDVEGESTPTQTKTIDITENGTTEVTPDIGYLLSKITVNTNVATSGGESKSAYGSITFEADTRVDTNNNIIVTHNLGFIPSLLVVFARPVSSNYNQLVFMCVGDSCGSMAMYYNQLNGSFTKYFYPDGKCDLTTMYDATSTTIDLSGHNGYFANLNIVAGNTAYWLVA